MKQNSIHFLGLVAFFLLLGLMGCQQSSEASKNSATSNLPDGKFRDANDALFISHESIAKAVNKQIWKEITFGEYNIEDLKLFDLGTQTSKLGDQDPYQIVTYGYQITDDDEIFRISLRSDLIGNKLTYKLNDKEYYTCTEKDYDTSLFSIEMKTVISKKIAEDYLQRKIIELNR